MASPSPYRTPGEVAPTVAPPEPLYACAGTTWVTTCGYWYLYYVVLPTILLVALPAILLAIEIAYLDGVTNTVTL